MLRVIRRYCRCILPQTILLATATCLLIYNEIKCANVYEMLEEAYDNVMPLNANEPLRGENDGRLVYICAPLQINEPLTEPDYGISIQAVKLKRRVQMYQWIEESSSLPDIENSELSTYYYTLEWRDSLSDSQSFYIRDGHENPSHMPIKAALQVAHTVTVGALKLSTDAKMKFDEFFEITGDERPERKDIKLHAGFYYHMEDLWNPKPGDIRIRFTYAAPSGLQATIIGKQENGTIYPYVTKKGHVVLLVKTLAYTVTELIEFERGKILFEVWITRIAAMVVIFIACVSIIDALIQKVEVNSFMYTVLTQDYINFCASITWFMTSSALVWIVYRPIVGVGFFIVASLPVVVLTMNNDLLNYMNYYQRL